MQETLVQFLVWEDPLEKGQATHSSIHGLPLRLSWVKNPPAMWETCIRSLGWEDPLEKEKAIHSSILVWRIPWTSPWNCKELDTTEGLSLSFFTYPTLSSSTFPLAHKCLNLMLTPIAIVLIKFSLLLRTHGWCNFYFSLSTIF